MEEVLVYGCMGLVGLVFTLFSISRGEKLNPVHQQLGRMDIRWDSITDGVVIYDGMPIQVTATYHEHELQRMRFTWPALVGTTLQLGPESLSRQLASTELEVDDRRFDDEVHVRATDDAMALALLDDTARSRIRKAISLGATFDDDRWRLSADQIGDDGLEKALRCVSRAHRSLELPVTPEALRARLEARATADVSAGVRHQALQVLVRRGLARDALLERCESDLQPAVRLTASRARGAEGQPGLEKLLATGSRTWKLEAAVSLAELCDGEHAEAETALLAALEDPDQVERAAGALARFGTPRLLPEMGAAHTRAPHAAITRAMASLRARGEPTEAGALALADEGGQVSLAAAGEGRLSETVDR